MAFGRDDVCRHGGLRRKCEPCDLEEERDELRAQVADLTRQLAVQRQRGEEAGRRDMREAVANRIQKCIDDLAESVAKLPPGTMAEGFARKRIEAWEQLHPIVLGLPVGPAAAPPAAVPRAVVCPDGPHACTCPHGVRLRDHCVECTRAVPTREAGER